jgi:predicted ATPase/DNA-binding CsgD family transcriptional regulator
MMTTALRASFVGRTWELAEISQVLPSTRLLTLMGAGGVGKTRLALEAAERLAPRYPEGVFYCDLTPIAEPDLVPGSLAAAFGLPPDAGPAALRERFTGSSALLVADNCEHVREAAAAAIADLLAAAPRLSVLATSRERLRLPAEMAWTLRSLTPDDSLELLLTRTVARAPDFRIGADNRGALEEICRRVDGLPLALELAAARLAMLAPEEVAHLLDDALGLLTGGEGVPRHRTMRKALEWSVRLLEPRACDDLWQLSVFPARFTLAGAAAVLDAPATEALERLAALRDASLLVSEPASPKAQFRLLEPVRQFAAERLTASGRTEARRLHAQHVLSMSEWIGRNVFGMRRQTEVLAAFELHLPDIRQAVEWSLVHEPPWAAQIMGWSGFAWEMTYRVREAAELMRRCEPVAGSARDRARLLVRLGSILDRLLDDEAEPGVFRKALQAAREAGDPRELGFALAFTANSMPPEDEPLELIAEALAVADREGDRLLELFVRFLNAQILESLGHIAESRVEMENTRAIAHELEDEFLLSQASASLISMCLFQGDNSAARRYLRTALKGAGEHPDWATTGALVYMSAALAARSGRPEAALRLVGAIKRWQSETGLSVYEHHRLSKHYDALSIARAAVPVTKAVAALRAGEAMKRAEAIALARSLVEERPEHPDDRLTRRELEIARLVASGLSNKEIAARLHLSVRTVEGHVERVLKKLDLRSRVGIGTWAIERGLL